MKNIVFYFLFFTLLFLNPIDAISSESVKIGLSLSLTGKYSPMGKAQEQGYRLWEADINNQGGILGKKVSLIIIDDKSEVERIYEIYEELINKHKVNFLFGPYSSPLSMAAIKVSKKYDYPIFIGGAASDSLWDNGFDGAFGVRPLASKYANGFLNIMSENNLKEASVFYTDDEFSVSVARGVERSFDFVGFKLTNYEGFKKGTIDLTKLAQKVKDKGGQVVILCGHFDESVNMIKAFNSINYKPKAFYATVGPAAADFYKILGKDAEFVFTTTFFDERVNWPKSKEFIRKYKKLYKKSPDYQSAFAYATGQIFEEAIKTSNSFDNKKLKETLHNGLNIVTIVGNYMIDKQGRVISNTSMIIQWQNGKMEIVWPKKLRTAKEVLN